MDGLIKVKDNEWVLFIVFGLSGFWQERKKKWIALLRCVSLGKCHIYHLNTSIWSKWNNLQICTSSHLDMAVRRVTQKHCGLSALFWCLFSSYWHPFVGFEDIFCVRMICSTIGLFLPFHSLPKILGVMFTVTTKTNIIKSQHLACMHTRTHTHSTIIVHLTHS